MWNLAIIGHAVSCWSLVIMSPYVEMHCWHAGTSRRFMPENVDELCHDVAAAQSFIELAAKLVGASVTY